MEFFDKDKDAAQREEERLARSLNRKKEPTNIFSSAKKAPPQSTTSQNTAPSAHAKSTPTWKLNEEKRKKEEEERQSQLRTKREEEEATRKRAVEDQIAARRAQEAADLHERNELDQFDPEKMRVDEEKLKREEELLLKRMTRATPGRTGPSQEEVAEHMKKIDDKKAEEERKEQEELQREERRHREYDLMHPKYAVDEKLLLEVIAELNKVRVSPKLYVKFLQSLIDEGNYSGNTLTLPGCAPRQTTEGVQGAEKAIEHLKTAQRLKMFTHSDGLSQSCYDLIRDHAPKGLTGNQMSDGRTVEARLNHYGQLVGAHQELIAYGFQTAEDLVLQWVLDDGDFSRRRRNILLNPEFSVLGISIGPHAKNKSMAVAVFATQFTENPKP